MLFAAKDKLVLNEIRIKKTSRSYDCVCPSTHAHAECALMSDPLLSWLVLGSLWGISSSLEKFLSDLVNPCFVAFARKASSPSKLETASMDNLLRIHLSLSFWRFGHMVQLSNSWKHHERPFSPDIQSWKQEEMGWGLTRWAQH